MGSRNSEISFLKYRKTIPYASNFGIGDAVKWRALDQAMVEACGKFADISPEALESLIDEAVSVTRQRNTAQPLGDTCG